MRIVYQSTPDRKTEYEKIESNCNSKMNRRCIDGKITGCGNCVGFCKYSMHPGFLTKEQRKEHDCLGKGCNYYVPKNRHPQKKRPQTPTADQILEVAIRISAPMEGLRFTSAIQDRNGEWKINYVTVSNDYPLDGLSKEVSDICGETVHLQQLQCDFEQAVRILCRESF